ncbi:MAG: hypothetical protein JNM57_07435 [Cyclobacteriaceae bacterium]|nr:hypothetical protein [Cyclobacteriaceae bacterium]
MKKTILSTVVIVTICLTQVSAQNSTTVPAIIAESFKKEFVSASNMRWENVSKDIILVRFNRQQDNLIAYFNKQGELMKWGKKITFDEAPKLVKEKLESTMKKYEKSNGKLFVTHVYEIIEEGTIRYYTNMGNDNLYLALVSNYNGGTRIIKKAPSDPAKNDGVLLASQTIK